MKPRIVRENKCTKPPYAGGLHEHNTGPTYLALPWPPECPYTPEQVMGACKRLGWELATVPYKSSIYGDWRIKRYNPSKGDTFSVILIPNFIGEPKKCEHPKYGPYMKLFPCPKCGGAVVITPDRRKGERRCVYPVTRRKHPGGPRMVGIDARKDVGRRSGNDRRKRT